MGPGRALSPRRELQPDPLLELSATCTYSVPLLSCSWLTSLVFYGMRSALPSPPTRFSRLPRSVGSLPVCLPVRGAACILIKGFCSPFVFMVLQIAFPATPLYSQRSALPPPGGPLVAPNIPPPTSPTFRGRRAFGLACRHRSALAAPI